MSAAPVVTGVEVGSTQWDEDFSDYLSNNSLGEYGYAIEVGSASQLAALPWNNIDQLYIKFDQDVNVDAIDLALTGVNQTQYDFADFFYDPQAKVARWTLTQALSEERLLIDLNSDGADPITGLSGLRLDGEWQDTVSTGPSGNGVEGGDFEFTFVTNPGDADRTGWVDYFDYFYVYYGGGVTTSDPTYDPEYDIDGSGAVDTVDVSTVFAELNGLAPTGTPAGSTSNAPQAAPNAHLSVDDDTVDYSVSLNGLFDDNEDPDSSLTYSVLSNSDASLFDSVTINATTGELIVNSAVGASGRSTVVVSATDTGGLSQSITITVDVDYQNLPPEISYFHASPGPANTWTISGYVADPDDDPTGWIVDIEGELEVRAAVWSDHWFVFDVILDQGEYGFIEATVTDPHGATSQIVYSQIGYS